MADSMKLLEILRVVCDPEVRNALTGTSRNDKVYGEIIELILGLLESQLEPLGTVKKGITDIQYKYYDS